MYVVGYRLQQIFWVVHLFFQYVVLHQKHMSIPNNLQGFSGFLSPHSSVHPATLQISTKKFELNILVLLSTWKKCKKLWIYVVLDVVYIGLSQTANIWMFLTKIWEKFWSEKYANPSGHYITYSKWNFKRFLEPFWVVRSLANKLWRMCMFEGGLVSRHGIARWPKTFELHRNYNPSSNLFLFSVGGLIYKIVLCIFLEQFGKYLQFKLKMFEDILHPPCQFWVKNNKSWVIGEAKEVIAYIQECTLHVGICSPSSRLDFHNWCRVIFNDETNINQF